MARRIKIVFRRIRGRIIPIRVQEGLFQDDFVNIAEIQKARKQIKESKSAFDRLQMSFMKGAKRRAKETGRGVARRIIALQKKRK